MQRKVTSGIMLALLSVGMLSLAFHIQPVRAEPRTWYVDDGGGADFRKIQDAINAAQSWDTIFVYNGIYSENVVVNKPISLVGENRTNTIMDAGGFGTVVNITANHVTVTGFTIRNSGTYWIPPEGGIYLHSWWSRVSGNLITSNNYYGIWLDHSYFNTIYDNTITSTVFYGIYLDNSRYNSVTGNIVTSPTIPMFGIGIYTTDSQYNNVNYNTITIYGDGLRLGYSGYNTFRGNNMRDNRANFGVEGWELSHFIQNIDVSNTVDGKPIYYLINQHDIVIDPSMFPNVGCLAVVNSNNITVRDLNLKKNLQGVLFAYTSNSIIENVTTSDNVVGIHLYSSSDNSLRRNMITSEGGYGFQIGFSSDVIIVDNTLSNGGYGISFWHVSDSAIRRNTITHLWYGIELYDSDYSNIIENNVTNNHSGILTSNSNYNNIYHNNFVDNEEQVFNLGLSSLNFWDDGYPSGGNYWSDYGGKDADSDGIGNTPYDIDANNRDRYPLMEPWSAPVMIKTIIRTVRFWGLPMGTENSLTSKLEDSLHLLDIGNENGATHKLMDFISQVEALRGKKLNDEQANYLVSEAQRIIDLIEK